MDTLGGTAWHPLKAYQAMAYPVIWPQRGWKMWLEILDIRVSVCRRKCSSSRYSFLNHYFFHIYVFGKPRVRFRAIPGGIPPRDWQSDVCLGDVGFEPGTAGQ